MRFVVIDAKRADYPIMVLCRALGVSRAGYYAFAGRPPSRRAAEDRRLAVLIGEAHERSLRTYGSPRVHAELAEGHGVFVSRKRVIRIMQREGLKARVRKRYRITTMSDHDQPVAPNLLDRQFTAENTRRALAPGPSGERPATAASATWIRCAPRTTWWFVRM